MNDISDYISLKMDKTNKKLDGVITSVAEKTNSWSWVTLVTWKLPMLLNYDGNLHNEYAISQLYFFFSFIIIIE